MSLEDALAKARAIAAKLSGVVGGSTPTGELGKRKSRWDEDQSGSISSLGLGATKKKKVYIPVKEHPEINYLGLLIGPRGRTQKELQERTGAKILIRGKGSQKEGIPSGHPDDDDEMHVSIEGPSESVDKATKEIEQLLFNPDQALRLKQEQLKDLAEMNGGSNSTSLTVMRDHYGNPMTIPTGEDGDGIELRVPNNLVGLIIGKGGEHIQKLQSSTGAHVQIAKESDMKPGETLRSIVLRGTPDAISEAKRRVEDLINDRLNLQVNNSSNNQSKLLSNNKKELDYAFILKIPVPNDKVGVVIGKGGVTIKSIQERTQAHVQVPTGPDEDNREVRTLSVCADSREAAEAAQMEIFMVLQQQQQQASMPPANSVFIIIPDDKVGVIIGRGGSTIKDIQNRTQTKIQIPQQADLGSNPPIRTCSIIGAPESQFLAKFEVETLLGLMPGGNSSMMSGGNPPPNFGALAGYSMGMYGGGGGGGGGGGFAPGMPMGMPMPMPMGMPMGMPMYPPMGMSAPYGAMNSNTSAAPVAPTLDFYGYQQQQQQQQQQDQQQQQQQDPATLDPTAYYADFWQYAAYYGEEAARAYYTTWSPPEGSRPPDGGQPSIPLPENQSVPDSQGGGDTDPQVINTAVAQAWEDYNKKYAEWEYESNNNNNRGGGGQENSNITRNETTHVTSEYGNNQITIQNTVSINPEEDFFASLSNNNNING